VAKVAIVGTGAMGSVYAGLIADAGHEVWAIDRWAEHVEAIKRNGLRVQGASGDHLGRPHASVRAADAGICDLVIIATKAMDVSDAALSARALVGPHTLVLTIQNGIGSVEKAAAALGRENLAVGIVGGFGASIPKPGFVHHNGWEIVHFGELQGPPTKRLEAAADIWRSAGFKVQTYDDIDRMIWEKFICNVCFSGTCTLTGLTIGQVIDDPYAWQVASGCASEAWRTAKAQGIKVEIAEPVQYVRDFGRKIPNARPSMLLDHLAKRRSEIDVINGAVPREAAKVGLTAPVNETVVALVKQREQGFSS
jgi:2-dehydropantoate 2-reductase